MEKLRIVFMGTPEFAVGILDTILKNNHEVVGVITAADKPAGRGQKLKYSAVKEYALENNITLLQPVNLKDETFLSELKSLNANLQVVVAFRMLPKVVWEMPLLGTFNLHASLLPNYRGALGSKTVIASLEMIEKGTVSTIIQTDTAHIETAYKLNKENCKIDWTKPAVEINNLIRGLSPYPTAWCFIQDKNEEWNVKIYEAKIVLEDHDFKIGSLICTKKEMKIAVENGFIQIVSLQFPGKKKMNASELLNGIAFSEEAKAH